MKTGSVQTRRSRYRLLLALGLLVLSQMALDVFIDVNCPLLRFPTAREVFHRLSKRSVNPDIVVVGSSRLQGAVSEKDIASCLEGICRLDRHVGVLNASVPAGEHLAQWFLLERLLQSGVQPRLVVLEVSPEFLNNSNPFYQYCTIRQLHWYDIPSHIQPLLYGNHLTKLASARFLPAYQHRREFLEVGASFVKTGTPGKPLNTTRLDLSPGGPRTPAQRETVWKEPPAPKEPTPSKEIQLEVLLGAERVRKKWLRDYEVMNVGVEALRRSVDRALLAGAEVLLVTPPVTTAHRAVWTPEIEKIWWEAIADLTTLPGCRHHNCRDWIPDAYFYDHHHTLPDGGVLFSRRFTREILAPWWQAKDEKH